MRSIWSKTGASASLRRHLQSALRPVWVPPQSEHQSSRLLCDAISHDSPQGGDMKRSLSVALLSAFLLLTDWTNSQPQAPQSQLSPSGAPASGNKPVPATTRVFGVVKDARGGVITKAVVTLTGESSKYSKQTKTTGNGTYVFEGIPVGTYAVTIAKEGFRPFSSTANVAESRKAVAVNATLSLASKPPVVFLRQIPGGGLPGGPDRGAGSP